MGAPVADTYFAPSGGSIHAGYFPMPAWRNAIAPNTWEQIPFAATMASLDPEDDVAINPDFPSSAPWHGTNGLSALCSAWNGAVVDQATGEIWWPIQHGHNDCWGNEVWRARLRQEIPDFTMMRPPTGAVGNEGELNDGQEATGNYFDGRPRAIHSYNKHCWVPGRGAYMSVQGNCSVTAAAGTNRTMRLGVDHEWEALATHPTPGTSSGAGTCYDELRDVIWYKAASTGQFWYFDLTDEDWTGVGTSLDMSSYVNLVRIPADSASPAADLIVMFNETLTNDFVIFDPSDNSRSSPARTGDHTGMLFNGTIGACWVESLGCICMWHNTTNRTTIYTFTPGADPKVDDWTIGTLTLDPSNSVTPSTCQTNGTYGRFAYVELLNGFFLMNNISEDPYFFALD